MNHPTLKSLTLGIGLFFTLPLVYANSSFPSSSDGTLYINKSKTRKVAPVKYGFHYEEIGMMGEGALHAELIRNRSFEEATPPAGLSVKNGLYENVPAPRVKEKKVSGRSVDWMDDLSVILCTCVCQSYGNRSDE